MTSRETISRWFDVGLERRARWMMVICDTFDHSDYPKYFNADERQKAINEVFSCKQGENMKRLMECYDFSDDKEEQMNAHRVMRIPAEQA